MSQKTTGWRSVLSLPLVYRLCQNLLGGSRSRDEFVKKYIRPASGMRILDLGCGPAEILEYLPEGIHYSGVDLSPEYIEAAQEKYRSKGEFHCLPVERLSGAGLAGFDLVMGLGVLHHLDDDQARKFFEIAAGALDSGGRCLTIDPCLVEGQHPAARFLIRLDRGRNVRSAEEYAALAETTFSRIEQDVRHDRLRVPYTHNIMQGWVGERF